jgi:hypothetical protein
MVRDHARSRHLILAPAELINAQSLLLVGPKAMADYVQAVASFAQQMD